MSPPANGTSGGSSEPSFSRPYNYPIYEPQRALKVVCIGAGASGLLLAYKLQRHFDNVELEVFEKNADVSGTWFENRYPGCACDVPSHCYTWSFEPKVDWSANYASSKEIFSYFRDFCDRHGLMKYIKLEHQVVNAKWVEEEAMWHVQVKSSSGVTETKCHVLVNAGGILNAWRYPPIPGIDTFKGELVHSAAWKQDLDLGGKVVGLIGNGSSGIQILPAIKDQVKQLQNFVREATWVAPPIGQAYQKYAPEEVKKFETDAEHHLKTRREIEQRMNGTFEMFHTNSTTQKQTRAYMESEMASKISNPELEKVLIPKWSVGCRRITPGTNYLEALSSGNVNTVFANITAITETGVLCDDGQPEYPVEVLICATGFDTTFKPRFPLIGTTGEALADVWKDDPKAYLGIAAPNYPNYFFTLGPNCPIGNGPVLIAIEAEVEYIIQMLAKFQKENIRSFDIKQGPVDAFNEWKDHYMQHTIWTEECRSWYKSGSAFGKVAALWPGSTLHYLEALRTPKYEDWTYQYQPNTNPWAYLGNGHSSAEKRVGGDLSYYIRNQDNSAVDPCLKGGRKDAAAIEIAQESRYTAAKSRFEPSTHQHHGGGAKL